MTQRIGKVILIAPESPQQCDDCGQVAELRPYGPGGTCICHPCAMKDLAGTKRRMGIILFGDPDPNGEVTAAKPNRRSRDALSRAQLEELEMELALVVFERDCAIALVTSGIEARFSESHRVCFRAGWKFARAADRGTP